jgi:AcrR family transcriptional regulator
MPGRAQKRSYHHGDLRTALVDAAIEMIADRGVREFSMAAASRRLGVTVSAPYAHFRDRDDLLAAVAVNGWNQFCAQLEAQLHETEAPAARLAAIAACYVRFAGQNRSMFELLFLGGLDKRLHPEIADAERPLTDVLTETVNALAASDQAATELATAAEAAAHGFAMLMLDGDFGHGAAVVEMTARRAAGTTIALVKAQDYLGPKPQ